LRFTAYFGFLVWLFSAMLLFLMVLTGSLNMQYYTTQAYFVVFIVFLVGIVLFVLGLLAVYLGQIHTEVVGRPLYVIRKRAGNKIAGNPTDSD
jgi:dolichol-phosphate mannosyltransferase